MIQFMDVDNSYGRILVEFDLFKNAAHIIFLIVEKCII